MGKRFLEELFSLKGKVVVVTGGGGAIAGVIAQGLAQCGAKVALLDKSLEAASHVSEKIVQEGYGAIALQMDVLQKASIEDSCKKVVAEFGQIDCLINGAGGNKKQATASQELSFFDISEEANRSVFDLNCMGTLSCCQVFGREIVKRKTGSIVNIASIAGYRPLTGVAAYAGAKAGVINFTKWLSVYLAKNYSETIRVNAIAPGFIATEQNRFLLFDSEGQLSKRGEKILAAVPQNRFGRPEELVSATIWLLSNSASFTTGSVITLDGGFDAFSGV